MGGSDLARLLSSLKGGIRPLSRAQGEGHVEAEAEIGRCVYEAENDRGARQAPGGRGDAGGHSVPHSPTRLRLVRDYVPIVWGTQAGHFVTAARGTDTPSPRAQSPGRCCWLVQKRGHWTRPQPLGLRSGGRARSFVLRNGHRTPDQRPSVTESMRSKSVFWGRKAHAGLSQRRVTAVCQRREDGAAAASAGGFSGTRPRPRAPSPSLSLAAAVLAAGRRLRPAHGSRDARARRRLSLHPGTRGSSGYEPPLPPARGSSTSRRIHASDHCSDSGVLQVRCARHGPVGK